ncbi:MAG: hypothetical protein K6G28_00130 [Acholeplasmatales bacterium]|nr:hypothetical protein [Acholeplasmatales bacterium]
MRLIKDAFNVVLVFSVIFMFKVISFIDSSMIVMAFLVIFSFFNKQYRKEVKNYCFSKKSMLLLLTFVLFSVWIILCCLLNLQTDFSYLKTLFHLLFQLIVCLFLYCFLKINRRISSIPKYLIISFIIQSIIIILGIISPSVRTFLLSTKGEFEVELANHYGFRGASLAGSSFFGLSISFGLLFIIFFSNKNLIMKKNYIFILISLVLLGIAGLSAGRVSAIGIIFGLLFFIVKGKRKFQFFINSIIIVLLFLILIPLLSSFFKKTISSNLSNTIDYFYFYITEFFNSSSGGFMKTTSTEFMFSTMFFPVELKTLLFGDGLYNVSTGYYMSTDSGIMRPILYAGLPSLIFLFSIQYQIMNFFNFKRKDKFLFWTIFIFSIILQIKGEVIGFANIFTTLLFLFSLSYENKKNQLSMGINFQQGFIKKPNYDVISNSNPA